MKKTILTLITIFTINSQAQNLMTAKESPVCESAKLEMTVKGSTRTWKLETKTKTLKWLMVKNEDTKMLYPKQKITKMTGNVYNSDFPKNKLGYKLQVVEVSQEESDKIEANNKVCFKKQDCSLHIKLNRCSIAEALIK